MSNLKNNASSKERKKLEALMYSYGSWEELAYFLAQKIESLEGDMETFSANALKRMEELQDEINELCERDADGPDRKN